MMSTEQLLNVNRSNSMSKDSGSLDLNQSTEIEDKIGKLFEKYKKSFMGIEELVNSFGKTKLQYPYSFEQTSFVGCKIIMKLGKIEKKIMKSRS